MAQPLLMAWTLVFSRRAERDLEDIDDATRNWILERVRSAARDPASVSLAKLKGRPGEWRIRTGAWRIIVELDTRTGRMIVTRVLPRRDAYR